MASFSELQDDLKCPIDAEYYDNPMVLVCGHQLCEKDVEKLLNHQDQDLKCPLCRQKSRKTDIRPELRTKRLIELHRREQMRREKRQEPDRSTDSFETTCIRKVCDFCEDEIAQERCEECDMYFGQKCKRGHDRQHTSRDHTMVPIDDIMKANKQKLQIHLEHIQRNTNEFKCLRRRMISKKLRSQKPKRNL